MQSYSLSGYGVSCTVTLVPGSGFKLAYLGPAAGSDLQNNVLPAILPASPDHVPGPSLMAARGAGYAGTGLIDAVCQPSARRIILSPKGMTLVSEAELVLQAGDDSCGVEAETTLSLEGGVLKVRTIVRNAGSEAIDVHRCAAGVIPLPDWADDVVMTHGGWAREGHESRRSLGAGRVQRVGRLGRSGFGGSPALTVCERAAGTRSGRAMALHLAWSGSHSLSVERLPDGSGEICAEALYEPGEIRLAPKEQLETPELIVVIGTHGFDELRVRLHRLARRQSRDVFRPVHFNTWEARYFDLNEDALVALAKGAAALGAERFVLDDGWFVGRRNDTTSLGDWESDPDIFPQGLAPLANRIRELDMSFGLWVEPEMVSRESRLYQQHPDWVLGYPVPDAPTGRNQLVLDLSNRNVQDHLFAQLSACLDAAPIEYLKWDCNREIYPDTVDGVARATRHVLGVYSLMDRLQARYPQLEIESCASGGGRIDFGILQRVTRFWASDATDALDRLRIQRSLSTYIPMEMIGCHVGPAPNPITGRVFSVRFRALVAMFGHFGLELDPDKLSASDRTALSHAIAVHKRFRPWMHSGHVRTISNADSNLDITLIGSADGDHSLVRVLRTDMAPYSLHPNIAVPGLDRGASFAVSEVSFDGGADTDLGIASAEGLAWTGLAMDPVKPNQGRLFYLKRIMEHA
ncbi:alpha-galactosidase [Hyphomonas sp.]|uniref:alpha-galactosidase n=1 Tax=Hyphomonas sp. TaxID=87 RepID=UPI0032EE8E85